MLEKYVKPLITRRHLVEVAYGLEILSRYFYEFLSFRDTWKAYYALQHVLRGIKFRYLRESLEKENTLEFRERARREADRLRIIADVIWESKGEGKELGGMDISVYCSCEACGPRLSKREVEILKEWWEKLGQIRYSQFPGGEGEAL